MLGKSTFWVFYPKKPINRMRMEYIKQTKEDFIKSAVLSAVILCICFVPFIFFL